MFYKWRCTGEGDKAKLSPERLKSLFAYNFHKSVGINHEIVLACGGVCGRGGGGVGS